jgi:hypothetical protein
MKQKFGATIGEIKIECMRIFVQKCIRKDCFQNKSKFTTEDHFTKHINITIRQLNLN